MDDLSTPATALCPFNSLEERGEEGEGEGGDESRGGEGRGKEGRDRRMQMPQMSLYSQFIKLNEFNQVSVISPLSSVLLL